MTHRKNALELEYQQKHQEHWDVLAVQQNGSYPLRKYYQRWLGSSYRFLVPVGCKVLEIGCADGKLLAALQTSLGVGVDFSANMLERAVKLYPNLQFMLADAHKLPLKAKFDIVILSDMVNDLWDVQRVFREIHVLIHLHRALSLIQLAVFGNFRWRVRGILG
jgi:ubiquinone/menaquinone biosynthesis C-methylase UbiE